jgi:hypothetical protein
MIPFKPSTSLMVFGEVADQYFSCPSIIRRIR